ncbi:collagen alpha-1(III) chain-like isoform X2 [Motacilla alba alba]|uniref:collagen alpha-1(III) chain-like isoform X2 n=1 Tax=Motacilla alba alba TaxID=1094192 RepID=UPI0018D534D5|nr:collagen alpha-1(III) chain-like isoform X2 [Motacilla alba alba]
MAQQEEGASSGLPDCPDLQQDVEALHSPSTPVYRSVSEEECTAIAARLRLGAAGEPSPEQGEPSGLQPRWPGPATSTSLPLASGGRVPDSSAGDRDAAAIPGPAPAAGEPGCLPRPALCPEPGKRGCCGPQVSGVTAGSRGTASARPALQNPLSPLSPAGTGPKPTSLARSRLHGVTGVSQQAQPSSLPQINPGERGMEDAAEAGSSKRPSSGLSTGVPVLASRSSQQPPSKRFCRDQGKKEQTRERAESSSSREPAPGLTPGSEDVVPAEQSTEDRLSRELEHLKRQMEHAIKAMEDAMQALERVMGIHRKDAPENHSNGLGED